jgi:hypothetical protein
VREDHCNCRRTPDFEKSVEELNRTVAVETLHICCMPPAGDAAGEVSNRALKAVFSLRAQRWPEAHEGTIVAVARCETQGSLAERLYRAEA